MRWEFNEINDLTRFAKYLCSVLKDTGHNELADRVQVFQRVWVFPATEYLGEFRILLQEIQKNSITLPPDFTQGIKDAITSINKAFNQD
jgi:hypothetical protein